MTLPRDRKLTFVFSILCWGLFSSYAFATAPYQEGALVRERGENKIFLITHGGKYWLRTPSIFGSYGYAWSNVKEEATGSLAEYPDITLVRSKRDPKIWYVQGDEKRWIASPEAFNANDFSWNAVVPVNDLDLAGYREGASITGDISGTSVTIDIGPALERFTAPPGTDWTLLWNVWNTIAEKYKGRTDIDAQKLVEGAAEGLVKALGDPYSTFMQARDAKKFAEDLAGEFYGIGAELGYKGGVVIIAPLKGLPAETAGLRAGDKIIRINDESALELTAEQAVMRIRGEQGTPVKLTIERPGTPQPLEFTIIRQLVHVQTVEATRKTNDTFVIRINNFFGTAENDFAKAVTQAKADGMRKLVLDLRNNPGGLLDASINIADHFLPKGSLIVSADFGGDKQKATFHATEYGLLETVPTVVLVNSGSASASEILAGALKDGRGFQLVGERTFGKGTIQELVLFAGGPTLRITTAEWLRPSGVPINEHGIEPDLAVAMTEEERAAGKDPQLEKALQVLSSITAY